MSIHLEMASRELSLRVADNGRGFEQDEAFSEVGGHFGLLGMRERASGRAANFDCIANQATEPK